MRNARAEKFEAFLSLFVSGIAFSYGLLLASISVLLDLLEKKQVDFASEIIVTIIIIIIIIIIIKNKPTLNQCQETICPSSLAQCLRVPTGSF